MHAKTVFLPLILLLTLTLAIATIVYRKHIAGWDRSIDPTYSPKFPVKQELFSRISRIALEQYGPDLQHHKLEFRPDGTAEYLGEFLFQTPATTNKFRVGRYKGRTTEFPQLSSWIASNGFLNVYNPCPSKRGYDVPVITLTISFDRRAKTVTTCGSYPEYNQFNPIELTIDAVENVANRIAWYKNR